MFFKVICSTSFNPLTSRIKIIHTVMCRAGFLQPLQTWVKYFMLNESPSNHWKIPVPLCSWINTICGFADPRFSKILVNVAVKHTFSCYLSADIKNIYVWYLFVGSFSSPEKFWASVKKNLLFVKIINLYTGIYWSNFIFLT